VSKNLLLCLILVSGFWLLVSSTARAQDQTQPSNGVVDNVIQQMQNGSVRNTTAPPAPTTVITPGSITAAAPNQNANPVDAAQQPGPIPGIVAQGDNAQLPAIPEPPPTWDARPSVILRALDKVTARTKTFTIPVGQQFNFGALTIAVRACRARPPLEPADAAAFLQIVEQKPGEPLVARFSGWMFSSSPSLSALEHPVYDVWVVGCGS
jgi:hypothetical protein